MGVITDFNPIGQNVRRQNLSPLDELMAQAELNAQPQQQLIPGMDPGQAIGGGGLAPGGVRGGEGPPLAAVRGTDGSQPAAVNNSMPTLDIWNGMRQTTVPYNGAPSTTVNHSAMPNNPHQQQLDLLQNLTDQARNNLPGGNANPAFQGILAGIGQTAAPIMANRLGEQRLGLDSQMQLGTMAPNGVPIPGAIANDATRAHAALLQAQNAPRAEDVAADMGAERRIEQLRANGMSEETAAGVMRRAGERLPRRLGGTGANVQSGSNAIPPWMGGPLANAPAVPSIAGGGSNAAAPGPNAQAPMRAVDSAFDIGNQVIPTTTGANGQQVRATYAENPEAYHNAITQVLQNIPDDQLRNHFPDVQRRLMEQFGGTQALDTWLNQMSSPITRFFSGQGTRDRQTQIQRILGMANMRQSPISLHSRGLTTPQVIGAAITSPSLGQ